MNPAGRLIADYRVAAGRISGPARALLLSTFLTWTGHGIAQVLYNLHLKNAGFQEAFVGRVVSAMGLGMALAALPAGWLADTAGRRRVLVAGGLLDGLAHLIRAFTLAPAPILGSTLLYGVAGSMIVIPAAPFLAEHSEARERTHLFSFYFAATLLAGVAGNLLGGQVPWLLLHAGWSLGGAYRAGLVLAALFAASAAAPLLALRMREARPARDPARSETRRARRHLFPIALNAFLIGAGAGLVIPFFNLYFATRFGCSSAQIGLFFSVAQVSTAAAALLGPALAARFGKLRTAVASELLSLPFLVTLGAERRLSVAVACFWARATFMQASQPLQNAFVMEALPPRLRARASSITNTVWNTGWAVSASISGWIIQHWGYAIPYYLTAAFYAVAALSFYLAFRRLPEPAGEPDPPAEAAGRGGEGPLSE